MSWYVETLLKYSVSSQTFSVDCPIMETPIAQWQIAASDLNTDHIYGMSPKALQ